MPDKAKTVGDALSRNISVVTVTQIPYFFSYEVRTAQRQDTLRSKDIHALETSDDSTLSHMTILLSVFTLKEDLLCSMGTVAKTEVTKVVIPSSLVGTVLKLLDDISQAGHPGRDRTLSMARSKYYWPTMNLDIERHIVLCLSCAETEGTTQTAPLLEFPLLAEPFDVVGIDLLQLPRNIQGFNYVLACVGNFTRFTILAHLSNESSTSVAHTIVSHLICPYTTPYVLLIDNGTEFKNQAFRDICTQFILNKHLLHLITLLPTASLNALTGKSLRFYVTLHGIYRKYGRIGFLTLLPLLVALSILRKAKRVNASCMDLRNSYFTMCLCTLFFPCTT